MTDNLLTIDEVAQYAPDLDTSSYTTTTLSGVISQVSAQIAGMCDVDGFLTRSVTSERDRAFINSQGELIYQFRRPIVAEGDISAVRLRTVDYNQALTLEMGGQTVYSIPTGGGYMIYPSQYLISFGRGLLSLRHSNMMVEVDYTGGYATDVESLPPDLKRAAILMLREAIAGIANNPLGVTSFSQGAFSMSFGSGSSKLYKQAMDILTAGDFVRRSPA